jgi:hypothetical protein
MIREKEKERWARGGGKAGVDVYMRERALVRLRERGSRKRERRII